jgi:hypothetical protein
MRTFGRLIVLLTASIAVALVLWSCASTSQPRTVPFDEAEFASYAGTGTGTLTGQGFLKTRGEDVKFGAGNEVVMVPVNSYTTEGYQRAILGGEILEPPDPRYQKYRRTTIADGHGNFEFRNIPDGDYYLVCHIQWEVPGAYGLQATGGIAAGKVKVTEGETARVILTR